jgi:hypothetical protein
MRRDRIVGGTRTGFWTVSMIKIHFFAGEPVWLHVEQRRYQRRTLRHS